MSAKTTSGSLDFLSPSKVWINDWIETKVDSLSDDSRPSLLEALQAATASLLTQDNDSDCDKTLNPRYKTEICRNFKERSQCVYGDRCQFAHGRKELRDVVRNSKYKTKLCQKYWAVGYCAYGPRCNFLHDEQK